MDVREGASSTGKPVALDLTGDFKTNSFGFGLGAQWLFGRNKNIVLDWNILGVHAGKGKLTLAGDYSATNLTDKESKTYRSRSARTSVTCPLSSSSARMST